MEFKEKFIVVTGAGAGIGRACALQFASEGAFVIAADINLTDAWDTVHLIENLGGVGIAHSTDVSNEESVRALVDFTLKHCQGVHALVNNAGVQVNKSIQDTTIQEWNQQMAVNLGGVFLCSKYFMPLLIAAQGSIINMSSVNGFFAEPSCAAYCATKAGIIGLTKAMAIDHGLQGVRVNCISPGYIDAGLAHGYFNSQADPQKARDEAGQLHALGRIGSGEEVAQMALFLASTRASFITGANMVVDGGLSAGLPKKSETQFV